MSEPSPFHLPAAHRPPGGRHEDAPGPVPYIASDELIEAVNLCIYLNRPLLLEGEAGSGKSQLARYVAHELGVPFFEWPVKSTSRAQEGLYHYDAILRLHDVQLAQLPATGSKRVRDPQDPHHYVRPGALGKAFRLKECSAVVLIDEIDKADIDFPNDLLTVLDEPRQITIHEAGAEPETALHPPIVIVTSNKEKGNLPAPFLRRCIYSFIEFPHDPERLKMILAKHGIGATETTQPGAEADELIDAAVGRFLKLREHASLFKKPGTSELLDWLRALLRTTDRASGDSGSASLIARLQDQVAPPPYPELLFKLRADWQRFALGR